MTELSEAEVERFTVYLEKEVASMEELTKQMEKLQGVPTDMIKLFSTEAAAYRIVIKRLRSSEIHILRV